MSNDMETQWIKKANKGDRAAFESLIIPYERKIYNIAFQIFKNEQDAFDATQEVFVKVYNNLSSFKFNASFSTWLHRLAMNTCIDAYRKRKRYDERTTTLEIEDDSGNSKVRELPSQGDTPETAMIRKETIKNVQQAIEQLNAEHKEVVILRDIQGLSYEEVAQILDISLGTVKSRLSRARGYLKELLMNEYGST